MLNGLLLLCCLPQYKGRVRINCMAVGGMFVHPDGWGYMLLGLYGACHEWTLGTFALVVYKVQRGERRAKKGYGRSCRLVFTKH